MDKFKLNLDLAIAACLIILISSGFLLILPSSPDLARHQIIFGVLGFSLLCFISSVDYRIFRPFGFHFYLGSALVLIGLLFFGEEIRGSVRWFHWGSLYFQPAEFLKPFLIIAFASFIANWSLSRLSSLLKLGALISLPLFLIFIQPDFGNVVIYSFTVLAMLIAAGLPLRIFSLGALFFLLNLPIGWFLLRGYQRHRITSFLNPGLDPLGVGYHAIQSLIAIGSGGFLGKGIGRGTQSRLQFLPEQHNDFILATLGEELGLIGVTVIFLVFSFFLWRIAKFAESAPDLFGTVLVTGIAAQFLIQMFVNSGMNMGLLPVTGVTFPFLSYGGSSLVAGLIGVGLVHSVARACPKIQTIDIDKIR